MTSPDFFPADEPLDEAPLFPVEAPDGRKSVDELARVVVFRQLIRIAAPSVLLFANANAGKRSPAQARREGIMAGVFDYSVAWEGGQIAYPEFKGYRAGGRPGKLSDAQIRWGNAMHKRGFPVACFFTPEAAVEWLRSLGAPVARVAA
jgi:hypothetical protein